MATATANCPVDNSTTTNYRLWAAFISQSFYNFGWTQTSDSGQCTSGSIGSLPVWSSVAIPVSIATNYEVWKAADTAASTTPIYVKIEYGATSTTVEIRITVGTGSNGSGTITGPNTGTLIVTNAGTYANNGSTAIPCFASGSAGEIRFLMWQGNASFSTIFGIERSKDTSGNITTTYFTFIFACAAGTVASQQSILGALITIKEINWITVTCSSNSNSENFNGGTAANPVFPLVGYVGNPMLGFASACANDVGEGAMVTVTIYSSSHTYIAVKSGSYSAIGKLNTNGVSGAALMRYE
jgi:hypothetical protein